MFASRRRFATSIACDQCHMVYTGFVRDRDTIVINDRNGRRYHEVPQPYICRACSPVEVSAAKETLA